MGRRIIAAAVPTLLLLLLASSGLKGAAEPSTRAHNHSDDSGASSASSFIPSSSSSPPSSFRAASSHIVPVEVDLNEQLMAFPANLSQHDFGARSWCHGRVQKADLDACAAAIAGSVPALLSARRKTRLQSLVDEASVASSKAFSGPGAVFAHPDACSDDYHVAGRCNVIRSLLRYVLEGQVPGDYVEAGTHIGDSAAVAAQLLFNRKSRKRAWLYDSFQGMPEAAAEVDGDLAVELSPGGRQTETATSRGGSGEEEEEEEEEGGRGRSSGWGHEASAEGVAARLARLTGDPQIATVVKAGGQVWRGESGSRSGGSSGSGESLVTIREGWFNETFRSDPRPRGAVAFLLVDCDWYGSVLETLEAFYDSVPDGGVVALDDFGYWEGARRALGDFLLRKGLEAAETSAAPFEFPLFERYGPDFLWWIKGRAHNRPLGSNGEGGEPGVADAA